MSLRDYFAAQALTAIIERNEIAAQAELKSDSQILPEDTTSCWGEYDRWLDVASACYAIADSMIRQRNVKP